VKILIVSDAWHPQINGVVRTLETTANELTRLGHETRIVGPDKTRLLTFAVPFYPEIKLEFFAYRRLSELLGTFQPDFIHIATEGPLGWAARRLCLRRTLPFTTAYHTRFPEYLAARAPRFLSGFVQMATYAFLRRFHAPASVVMVATASIERELRSRKFRRLVRWSRGVDANLFRPYGKDLPAYSALPRPILLYVGRVAVEKNLRAFLDVDTVGSHVVIGDGPDLASLRREYPGAHFLGAMSGENLARHYAPADVFVFPSTTDTFGLVLLEACAAGLRVAAMPAPGPSDIFADDMGKSFAVIDNDLGRAVAAALQLPDHSDGPRAFARQFTWEACTQEFFVHLQAPTPRAVRLLTRWRNRIARI
jgi:glycosyltransferase involved in cell wall biosynthesis